MLAPITDVSTVLPEALWCNRMPQHRTIAESTSVWRRLGGARFGVGPASAFRADEACCSLDKVQSVLEYADVVLGFKLQTLEQQREFADAVAQSLARSTSDDPCQRFFGGALQRRVAAVLSSLPLVRKGFRLVRQISSGTLSAHCLLTRGVLFRRKAARAIRQNARRLVGIALQMAALAHSLFDEDAKCWQEAEENGMGACFPLPFAAMLSGSASPKSSQQQMFHDVRYPFFRKVVAVRTWHVFIDRFSLSLSRLPAKLGYQIKAFTSSIEPAYAQEPLRNIFWSQELIVNPEAQAWQWPNHADISSRHRPSNSRLALVLLISNRTRVEMLEELWSQVQLISEASDGLDILWLEDTIREPWVTSYRPEHAGLLAERCRKWQEEMRASGENAAVSMSAVWRRHQATLANVEVAAFHLSSTILNPRSQAIFYELRGSREEDSVSKPESVKLLSQLSSKATNVLLASPETSRFSYMDLAPVRSGLQQEGSSNLQRTIQKLSTYLTYHQRVVRLWREDSASTGGQVRALVYACNPYTLCGGHGDRTNGILSTFVLSILTSRAFFIDLDSPLPLSMLLQPRRHEGKFLLDWRIRTAGLGLTSHSFYLDDRLAFQEDLGWLVRDPSPVLLVSMNHRELPALLSHPLLRKRAEELGLPQWPHLLAHLWDVLFEPAPLLRARLQAAWSELDLGSPMPWMPPAASAPTPGFIGIHFRAGNESARAWWDPARHSLSSLSLFLDCAAVAEKELGLPSETKWYLSADTTAALGMEQVVQLRRTGKLVSLGDDWPIAHVDRSHVGRSFGGFAESYVGYYLLASARAVVLSRSFFGETAAEVGAVPDAFFAGSGGCVRVDLHGS